MMRATVFRISLTILLSATITALADVPLETLPVWQSSETGVYTTGMVWRDINLDGYIDVVYSNGNDMALARNTVYLSGEGVLPVSASWFSNNYEYSGHCAVGDLDDNGFPDLIVSNYLGSGRFATANHSQGYFNYNGALSPSPDWQTDDSIYTFSCALGDVDNDGDLDLAFATGEGYTTKFQRDLVYFNVDGQLQTSPGWRSHHETAALDVTWGDVDNDGDLDLALCYDFFPTSIYYNQNGTLDTLPGWQSSQTLSGNTLTFGDINGDGWLDLIVAYNNQLAGGGFFRVYFNDGTGSLNTNFGWQSFTGGYGSALALYDYDNDGDDDLAAGRWFDRPRIYENLGSTFSTIPVWRAGLETTVEELAWVDLDGDGVREYVDTLINFDGRQLFYTSRHPLYVVDSVVVNNSALSREQFCYDLTAGWISFGVDPGVKLEVYYQYSAKNDLAVGNWGEVNDVYPNNTGCCGWFTSGLTGNVNCSEDGRRNLADITRLIDRVYLSKSELCCEENGNVDGDVMNKINLADITRLIDNVYVTKSETAPCH